MRRRRLLAPAGCPRTVADPAVIFWFPTTVRIRVVLPQPDGPSNPVMMPSETDTVTSSRTVFPPRMIRSRSSWMAGGAFMPAPPPPPPPPPRRARPAPPRAARGGGRGPAFCFIGGGVVFFPCDDDHVFG